MSISTSILDVSITTGKKWGKMAKAAEKAVAINPNFAEAEKMLKFAKKKMA